jgi:hypothetical protein
MITIGRIVHYVLENGRHRPAFVVAVWPGEFPDNAEDSTGVNLQVFVDGSNDIIAGGRPYLEERATGIMWITSARFAAAPSPGTWHWPEKE